MTAAYDVFHSSTFVLNVCSFQDGVTQDIQALLKCPIIEGLYGRLIHHEVIDSLVPNDKCIYVNMKTLPTLMEHRHQLVSSILTSPRAAANFRAALAVHPRLRDIVAEYAAFYGNMELMGRICKNAKDQRLPWDGTYVNPSTGLPTVVHSSASQLCQLAAFNGHASLLMLLGHPKQSCIRHGNLTSSMRHGISCTYSDIEVAAERGQPACLQVAIDYAHSTLAQAHTYWGLCNRVTTCRLNLLDVIAGDGNMQIAQILFQEGATHSQAAIDNAATNGHLVMVKSIHGIPESECTTQAMDGAAANGHLEVVQFLHNYRTEGCTTDAVDAAAQNGHDEVVQFLLAERKEGGTANVMNAYVARGDLAMVKFLNVHMGHPELCVAKFMQIAHISNHLAIVEYFDSHRCKCCKDVSLDDLVAANPR
ncbi:Aste57867_32 [Aphanomyces stellatus]|uniref:Aste57867_32 protein n=1 Tax=Aphanomyces stellatus TaxID=120398 RepID=A0A485K6I4_9STRA|nr:hypothetical protein As57867_000032 [Aphanomyces stellatus]VFT77258.1 Aste57867_32 [Aphanomyces stellatus]